jgi:hypothetical protein
MNKAILVINSCTTIAQLQSAIRYIDLYCRNAGITEQLELIELLETKQKQLS